MTSPWQDLLPALSKEASRAPEDTYLPTLTTNCPGRGPSLKGISLHPRTEKGSGRNWTQADCNGSGPTSAQLQIFWGSGHHRLTYPYRHSESAIALIPMYNSGIDRLRRLEPNMDQSC